MSIGRTWCTLEEASAKYSIDEAIILKWIDEGVVRGEIADHKVVQVNVDDIELEVQERGGIFNE